MFATTIKDFHQYWKNPRYGPCLSCNSFT